jgi:hypothetical protein
MSLKQMTLELYNEYEVWQKLLRNTYVKGKKKLSQVCKKDMQLTFFMSLHGVKETPD